MISAHLPSFNSSTPQENQNRVLGEAWAAVKDVQRKEERGGLNSFHFAQLMIKGETRIINNVCEFTKSN